MNPLKNQTLISSKDKSKKSKCRQLQFLFGVLTVNFVNKEEKCLKQYGSNQHSDHQAADLSILVFIENILIA